MIIGGALPALALPPAVAGACALELFAAFVAGTFLSAGASAGGCAGAAVLGAVLFAAGCAATAAPAATAATAGVAALAGFSFACSRGMSLMGFQPEMAIEIMSLHQRWRSPSIPLRQASESCDSAPSASSCTTTLAFTGPFRTLS